MSPVMFCPGCGKGLTFEDRQAGYCPSCGKSLVGPSSAPPRPVERPRRRRDEDEDEDRGDVGRMSARDVLGWGTSRTGLGLVTTGAILFAVAGFLLLIVLLTAGGRRGMGDAEGFAVIAGIIAIIGGAITLVGAVLAPSAPDSSGARGWAIGFLICFVLLLVLDLVVMLMSADRAFRRGFGGDGRLLFYLVLVVGLLAHVFYMLHLRAIAIYFQRDGLGASAMVYMAINVVLSLLLIALVETGSPVNMDPQAFLLILVTIGEGMLIWFATMTGGVRGAITQGVIRSLS